MSSRCRITLAPVKIRSSFRVVRRTGSFIALAFAWLCAQGALWDCVQVFAWGKMLHDYSQMMPLEQAIAKTFDGSAPCELCVVVDQARQQETPPSQAPERGSDKVLLALHVAEQLVTPRPEFSWPEALHRTGEIRTELVPVPPPRV